VASDTLTYTRELADRLNCSHVWGQSVFFVQCLKQFTPDELINVDISVPKYLSAFGPIVNGRGVLSAPVRSLLGEGDSVSCDDGEFGRTPLLLGVRRDEGYNYMSAADMHDGVTDERLRRMLRTYVQNTFVYHQQKIYDILLHNYNGWDRPRARDAERDDITQLLGDGQIVAPSIELAQYHARCGMAPTYLYSFSPLQKSSGLGSSSAVVSGERAALLGFRATTDGEGFNDDLAFVFGAPLGEWIDPFRMNYSEVDRSLAASVLTYWINFIKTE